MLTSEPLTTLKQVKYIELDIIHVCEHFNIKNVNVTRIFENLRKTINLQIMNCPVLVCFTTLHLNSLLHIPDFLTTLEEETI